MIRCRDTVMGIGMVFALGLAGAAQASLPDEAADALRRAVGFFCKEVSTQGGYLWRYSADLARREGEGKASADVVWVQPPGTPSVGLAYLQAYERCGEKYLLQAAQAAGLALVNGQLLSGGWDYRIDFSPAGRKRYAYRVETKTAAKRRNTTTLDDNNTQAALRLLMRLDRVLDLKDAKIHEAAQAGLESLLNAQYPNGAWPQRFVEPPDPSQFPVKPASYPESWSREYPKLDYRSYYTFNDNSIADVIDVMFEAAEIYGDKRYRQAAEKGGGFMLLAQMPEPQPGWAQQYDANMHPAWARKFEPPSITGGEAQGVMRTLMRIYRETGDKKYLEPLPRAIAYYRRSLRPDGKLARFYELKTNRPLYFTKDYKVTYSDADMPTHYAFIVGSSLDSIEKQYHQLCQLDPNKLRPTRRSSVPRMSKRLETQAKQAIASLDERGAWVESGRLKYNGEDDPTRQIIDCRTFIRNIAALSNYLAAAKR